MKNKKFTILLISFVMTFVLCMTCCMTAFAEESSHAGIHGSQGQAQVSQDVDVAEEKDNNAATNFFMYIEPDKITHSEVPDMGDAGLNPVILLEAAFCVGVCYLGCNAYANKKERT